MRRSREPLLRFISLAAAGISILAAASIGRAQAPPAAPAPDSQAEPEIVVVGTQDQRAAIREYVDRVTVATGDQIATFWDRVCPASFGLPSAYNEVIERRVREVARQAGIQTAQPGCLPNVVIIVSDGGLFIDRLHRERPDIFRGLALSDIRQVLRDDGPIQAWQVVVPRGSDGRPLEHIAFLEMGGRVVYVGDAYLRRGLGSSLTQKQTRQDLSVCFVVFDLDALEGLTLTQIADYAAMRTLARTSPASIHGRRTILSLFNDIRTGDAPAEAMTGWDTAYLRALYATNSTVSAFQQRSNMVLMIERGAARPQDEISLQPGR